MNCISQNELNGISISLLVAMNIIDALEWSLDEWEEEANKIYADNSWRRAGRRGKKVNADDYHS